MPIPPRAQPSCRSIKPRPTRRRASASIRASTTAARSIRRASRWNGSSRRWKMRATAGVRQRHGGDVGRAGPALRGRSRRRQRRPLRRHVSPLLPRARALRARVHLRRHVRPRRRSRGGPTGHQALLGGDADQSAAQARRHRGDRVAAKRRAAGGRRQHLRHAVFPAAARARSAHRRALDDEIHRRPQRRARRRRDHRRRVARTRDSAFSKTPSAACRGRTTRG